MQKKYFLENDFMTQLSYHFRLEKGDWDTMKKLIAYFLAITLVFTNIGIVRASEITDNIPDLILSDI